MSGCHTGATADLDRVDIRISEGLRNVLRRVGTLALGMTAIATVVGIATFATGLWIFDRRAPTFSCDLGATILGELGAVKPVWRPDRAG